MKLETAATVICPLCDSAMTLVSECQDWVSRNAAGQMGRSLLLPSPYWRCREMTCNTVILVQTQTTGG